MKTTRLKNKVFSAQSQPFNVSSADQRAALKTIGRGDISETDGRKCCANKGQKNFFTSSFEFSSLERVNIRETTALKTEGAIYSCKKKWLGELEKI